MRLIAVACGIALYLWAALRSLPPEAHHVINILVCFAILTLILTMAGTP